MNHRPQDKLEAVKKTLEDPNLSAKQRRGLTKKLHRLEKQQTQSRAQTAKTLTIITPGLLIIIVLIVGFKYLKPRGPKYPPINLAGHVETYPPTRFSRSPIPEAVHKHILEHTPQGKPGVVITYNCTDFRCDPGLYDKLKALVEQYPHLYVAAGRYSSKIIVSKVGQRITLDDYNEEVIVNFIKS